MDNEKEENEVGVGVRVFILVCILGSLFIMYRIFYYTSTPSPVSNTKYFRSSSSSSPRRMSPKKYSIMSKDIQRQVRSLSKIKNPSAIQKTKLKNALQQLQQLNKIKFS